MVPDPKRDLTAIAARLGISREAVELHYQSEVIDLHIDTFIWARIFGYDLLRRHGRGPLGARHFGQVDLPRALEAGLTGATWVITTNPLPNAEARHDAFRSNLAKLRHTLEQAADQVALVTTAADYWNARRAGKHAAFLGIQGGNALDPDLSALDPFPRQILRVTLVHLSDSDLGSTSSPISLRGDRLTSRGKELVKQLESRRIFPDLAHLSRGAFWDAVRAHDPSLPLLVSHTGVSGVHDHWRNIDDQQLKAVADSGGTVGIMYEIGFLGGSRLTGRAETIAQHISHVIRTVGEDHVSLGSDWDGNIVTPRDMPTCLELPILTERLLGHGWSPECIQKVLGRNFLRVLAAMRG